MHYYIFGPMYLFVWSHAYMGGAGHGSAQLFLFQSSILLTFFKKKIHGLLILAYDVAISHSITDGNRILLFMVQSRRRLLHDMFSLPSKRILSPTGPIT